MSELICEELAHKAGFPVSVGNWIAPNGDLILGKEDQHHWETLVEYWGKEPETDNPLQLMNDTVDDGFIRLVFRSEVMFQVGALGIEDLWGDQPQYCRMMMILEKLSNYAADVHIFSRHFYVIGTARDIFQQNLGKLQIKVKK